ncbi:glycosyltransferase involved in cell wall biosynthesis [Rathayibacter sp. PhB179]|nr:glycosyltransferase involved in cell wall biosynthesis [Rathayibacter sp. PhB192]TCM30133.1 glycosyltransferase involved in cell wall biosynthesis [Rathayibacter sp. PhB179]
MRVCIVSVPLTARSGVYRSTYDLVTSARSKGLDWHGIVAMRPGAAGGPPDTTDGIFETTITQHGASLIPAIEHLLLSRPEVRTADVVITMIGQSDVAMTRLRSGLPGLWVSFVRGLPWPAAGEATVIRRLVQFLLVARAMRAADEVWVTTAVLAAAIRSVRKPTLIPAGVPHAARTSHGEFGSDGDAIFAGRLDVDKRPAFFTEIVRALGVRAKIYGRGPLESSLQQTLPPNAELCGWTEPDRLWDGASVFLGTSLREAFGRSAVEAALRGVPVILSKDYGAADFLFTDEALARQFVLDSEPIGPWIAAVRGLYGDPELRRRVSDHVRANALELSIDRSVDRICERLEILQKAR